MTDFIVIRRYPNRKFYDTSTARYVSLKDIYDHIKSGDTIRVYSHGRESAKDITREVLMKALLEYDKFIKSLTTDELQSVLKNDKTIASFVQKTKRGE